MVKVLKNYNGIEYDVDKDYSLAMEDALKAGDYDLLSSLERRRNAKIDGEGLDYEKTYKYQNAGGSSATGTGSGGASADIFKKIQSREPFKYDYTKDPSYKALEAAYKANGKYAMQDTLGDAAALTGGRASTAAVSASQQTYNRYMQQLSENIPALEQAAYGRYQDETQDLYNQYSLLYSQERDKVSDEHWERSFGYTQERDKVSDEHWDKTFDYTKTQDAKQEAFEVGGITGDYSGLLEHGYSQEEVDALNQTGAKDEALKIAGITGDYSGLLQYGWSQETVDSVNAAVARGVEKEEIDAALKRASIAAQYGDFSLYLDAGFDKATVDKMQVAYNNGELKADALLAAEFGDYSGLEKLGIEPAESVDKDAAYNRYVLDIKYGSETIASLLGDVGFRDIMEDDPSFAIRVLDAARDYAKDEQDKEYAKYAIKVLQGTAVEDLVYDGEKADGVTDAEAIQSAMGDANYTELLRLKDGDDWE